MYITDKNQISFLFCWLHLITTPWHIRSTSHMGTHRWPCCICTAMTSFQTFLLRADFISSPPHCLRFPLLCFPFWVNLSMWNHMWPLLIYCWVSQWKAAKHNWEKQINVSKSSRIWTLAFKSTVSDTAELCDDNEENTKENIYFFFYQ